MKAIVLRTVIACLCVAALSGCATENVKEALDNLSRDCVRHYNFAASTGVPASITIAGTADCQPSGAKPLPPNPTP